MKELSLLELNELIYCVGVAKREGALTNDKVATQLEKKLRDELEVRCAEHDKFLEECRSSLVELERVTTLHGY